MTKFRYLPDVVTSIAAFVIGAFWASYLHWKWYYGGWMSLFGDPPAIDPAYNRISPLFQILPYVAGGVAAGFFSGFGYFEPVRLAIRCAGMVTLFAVSYAYNGQLAVHGLLPAAAISFMTSTALYFVYFRLSLANEEDVKDWAERWKRWRTGPGDSM
jgi:hypothetical protein